MTTRKRPPSPKPIEQYLEDKCQQNRADATLYKLDNIFRKQLGGFCRDQGLVYPDRLTRAKLLRFRSSWRDQAVARMKKQERLAAFFRLCIAQGWMNDNPAKHLYGLFHTAGDADTGQRR